MDEKSVFGLALGLRSGGVGMLVHGALAPAALLGSFAVASPSLYVALAVADAPVDPLALARAVSRGIISAGLLLGGLAPLVGLFTFSGETAVAGAAMGWASLVVAIVVGLIAFYRDLAGRAPRVAVIGFALFAGALALRIGWVALPALRGVVGAS